MPQKFYVEKANVFGPQTTTKATKIVQVSQGDIVLTAPVEEPEPQPKQPTLAERFHQLMHPEERLFQPAKPVQKESAFVESAALFRQRSGRWQG